MRHFWLAVCLVSVAVHADEKREWKLRMSRDELVAVLAALPPSGLVALSRGVSRDDLAELLEALPPATLVAACRKLTAADAAELFDGLPPQTLVSVAKKLKPDELGEVLVVLPAKTLAAVAQKLSKDELTALIHAAPPRALTVVGKKLPKEDFAKLIGAVPPAQLLVMGKSAIADLGVYRLKLTKEERLDGKLNGPQVMGLTVRESPFSVRGEVTDGPAKGRKLLFNKELKADEVRVREAGILGVAAVWLKLDNSLTRADTKHPITDLGYGPLMALVSGDLEKSMQWGGHLRADEGFDKGGNYCIKFTSPAAATGLYGKAARVCLSPSTSLLTSIEISDASGIFERFKYELVNSGLKVDKDFFTPDSAGL